MDSKKEVLIFEHSSDSQLKKLRGRSEVIVEKNIVSHCLDELFEIEYPWLKPGEAVFNRTREQFLTKQRDHAQGPWVYYPWSKTLIHFPLEDIYIRLRSGRNRNLITAEEQKILQSKTVGIGGMSVGSNILNMLVLTSGPRHIKIADHDEISVPNLNRIMATAASVGLNKAEFFARRALEVDPFLKIDVFKNGLRPQDFRKFFEQPKLDLFIEEMDDPYLKIQSRLYAKRLGIPVIMAADNGHGALVDVERFDIEPNRPLFHGRLDRYDLDHIPQKMPFSQKLAIIADMVSLDQADPRAQDSLEQVGTQLNTWPQLGTAAVTAGVALTVVVIRILLGLPMPSGRYDVNYDSLIPSHKITSYKRWRAEHTDETMKAFRNFQDYLKKMEEF